MSAQAFGRNPDAGLSVRGLALIVSVKRLVMALGGWRRRALLFLAGAVSTLAFAPVFFWPVMFGTFPILLWQIEAASRNSRPLKAAFWSAWWFGFGYFFAGLFWVGEAFLVEAEIFAWLLPVAITILPAGLALFWGVAGLAAEAWRVRACRAEAPVWAALQSCLILACCLGVTEWLRGHILTGFPWDPPGVALTYPLPLMQAVSVFGMDGLTPWAVLIFCAPFVLMAAASARDAKVAARLVLVCAAVPLALAYGFGAWHLSAARSEPMPGVKLRIVQPSVPQRDKWMAAKQPEIFAAHLDMSRRNPQGVEDNLSGITHVIWPEASMPFGPLDHPEALKAIGDLLPAGTLLIAGALRGEPDDTAPWGRKAYNSLMVFGAGGKLEALYDKVHLVPFGEYLPFQRWLEAVGLQSLTRQRGGFASGVTPKSMLRVAGLPPVSPLICYEAIFPWEAAPGRQRPGLIVIVTNDGWFGNTTGPRQHFHQARLRAVEQGVSVIRAANNGISAVIDPQGRIVGSKLKLNVRGAIDSILPVASFGTIYSFAGDLILGLNVVLFFVLVRLIKRLS